MNCDKQKKLPKKFDGKSIFGKITFFVENLTKKHIVQKLFLLQKKWGLKKKF